jgi:hypothetical protein
VPIPTTNLSGYLNSSPQAKAAAVALGKALFWDMQAGGDGNQAYASRHFNADADSRAKGQMHPGADGKYPAYNTNYTPSAGDYPYHKLADVNDRNSRVID